MVSDYLYVGVENRATEGAQIWRHPLLENGNVDDTTWQPVPVAAGGFSNPSNFLTALTEWSFGESQAVTRMLVWMSMRRQSSVFQGGWPGGPSECPLPPIAPINNLCVTNLTLKTVGNALFLETVNSL